MLIRMAVTEPEKKRLAPKKPPAGQRLADIIFPFKVKAEKWQPQLRRPIGTKASDTQRQRERMDILLVFRIDTGDQRESKCCAVRLQRNRIGRDNGHNGNGRSDVVGSSVSSSGSEMG